MHFHKSFMSVLTCKSFSDKCCPSTFLGIARIPQWLFTSQKRKGHARKRWKRKDECESAPLRYVSCAYSSVGASQFPSARILFAHVASAAVRILGKQVQRPLGSLASPNPFSFSCIIRSLT